MNFSKASFETVVMAYLHHNLAPKAEEIIDEMLNRGMQPSRTVFQMLIYSYCRRKEILRANRALERMQSKGYTLDSNIAAILIDAYIKECDVASIHKTLQHMKEARLQPTVLTFSSIIGAYCSHRMYAKANQLLLEMDKVGLAPTDVTYTVALSATAQHHDAEQACRFLDDMQQRKLAPLTSVAAPLVVCFAHTLALPAALAASKTLIDMLHGANRLDSQVVDTVIRSCSDMGKSHLASQLIEHCKTLRCSPSLDEYNHLIYSVARTGMALAARHLLNEMLAAAIEPNQDTYAALILAYAPSADYSSAYRIIAEMTSHDLKPTARIYHVLLTILARSLAPLSPSPPPPPPSPATVDVAEPEQVKQPPSPLPRPRALQHCQLLLDSMKEHQVEPTSKFTLALAEFYILHKDFELASQAIKDVNQLTADPKLSTKERAFIRRYVAHLQSLLQQVSFLNPDRLNLFNPPLYSPICYLSSCRSNNLKRSRPIHPIVHRHPPSTVPNPPPRPPQQSLFLASLLLTLMKVMSEAYDTHNLFGIVLPSQ